MNIYILFILAVLIAIYFVYNKEGIYNSVKEGLDTATSINESTDGRCGPNYHNSYCSSGKYCDNNGFCGITESHKTQLNNYSYDAPDVKRKDKLLTEDEAKKIAQDNGLTVNDNFASDTYDTKGLYAYDSSSSDYPGEAYFGKGGKIWEQNTKLPPPKYRPTIADDIARELQRNAQEAAASNAAATTAADTADQRSAEAAALAQQREQENTQTATNEQTTDEQDKVGAVSTSMDTCIANCAAPVKASGRCEGAPDGSDRRGYNDNPIIDSDGSYYKNCDNICLTPGMDGYVEKMPTDGTPYNPLVHGCRTSTQCKSCGTVKVDIPKDSGKWVKKERGGVEKLYWEPKNRATAAVGYANQNLTQCEMKRMQGLHKDTCPADSWTPEERQRKVATSYQSYNDEDEEAAEVKPKHASDTDTGNMFLDVTNPDHIGQKDLSLEDYYNRQLLNKYSENRLGGSKSAYTDTYKPDKGQKKPNYFNSVWKLF